MHHLTRMPASTSRLSMASPLGSPRATVASFCLLPFHSRRYLLLPTRQIPSLSLYRCVEPHGHYQLDWTPPNSSQGLFHLRNSRPQKLSFEQFTTRANNLI